MNFELASEKYLSLRDEVERIDREAKQATAKLKATMTDLENWITIRAQEEGLETVKTEFGTAYWSTHHKATVASRDAFFQYCRENDAWDLLEARASKSAVASHIVGFGKPPPGVDYSSVRVFNLRKSSSSE